MCLNISRESKKSYGEKKDWKWGKSEKLDVNEQKTDEDYLLGNSNKPNEDQDGSSEVSHKNDQGTAEMEQDFLVNMSTVSEDFEENDEDVEDINHGTEIS